jgi:hypothetical protein
MLQKRPNSSGMAGAPRIIIDPRLQQEEENRRLIYEVNRNYQKAANLTTNAARLRNNQGVAHQSNRSGNDFVSIKSYNIQGQTKQPFVMAPV